MGDGIALDWLIPLAGPITAVPLILFALAAKRLKLATIGMMQYLTPTLQFLIAVVIFREPFGPVDAVAFGLIWTALAVFTVDHIEEAVAVGVGGGGYFLAIVFVIEQHQFVVT